jgi:hypothetical protein
MSLVLLQILTKHDGDWTISVHPRHGSKGHDQKHVHIKKRGLKGEYSWNMDGSRHDKHKFPVSEQCISRARDLAANSLKIPVSTLQFITKVEGGVFISIQENNDVIASRKIFNSYVHKDRFVVVFGGGDGLIIAIENI